MTGKKIYELELNSSGSSKFLGWAHIMQRYHSDRGAFVIIRQPNYVHQLLSQFEN